MTQRCIETAVMGNIYQEGHQASSSIRETMGFEIQGRKKLRYYAISSSGLL